MNPLDKQAADASDLSGGEATGEQSACPASDAAKVSPEFRADPSFTYLLTDNLVEANKEILRLRDENEKLRLAALGGEDAPGYAASLALESVLRSIADNHATTRHFAELAYDGETGSTWKARAEKAESALEEANRDRCQLADRCLEEVQGHRDEKAALIKALAPFASHYQDDVADSHWRPYEEILPYVARDGIRRWLAVEEFLAAREVYARLTRQEGSEEGDRLGRRKVGAGCEQTLSKEGQQ